ncbi:dicarboxylate/amino acid:cation symporter [Parapedobacter koreensis]|uniref:Aerobic C4-dicarboxylate transport protein n=1 Tax=Parapedobacter koreensis TaxID=332977 RepID=A0A1H7QEI8_9SPHI|nr:dicarboxylate/amino acid:cation symporter [Parapedobacter koreensis]SEL46402.1 aerobic C4-dicarboxylate transport protein [Parapedobacter koreensis]
MKKLVNLLYFQVVVAIIIGILIGHFYPSLGVQLKPLGDGFIKLIKMVIAPLIFCSIVLGIAGMEDVKKIGKVGVKALLYFQLSTMAAMFLGIVVINVLKPGEGMHVDAKTLDTSEVAPYIAQSKEQGGVKDFLLDIIPENVFGALSTGNLLQVLFFAVLFGYGLSKIGARAEPAIRVMQSFLDGLFAVIKMIMKVAPIGAMGAMGFTIGKYGISSLSSLGMLMVAFYITCLLYIFLALGLILKYYGISIFKLLRYIREELLVVLGTSSSESVLPAIMQKLEHMGCSKPVVRLAVPTGYSFNLDGTTIYLTMAAIFLSQALDMPMSLGDQLFLLFVLTITSNGAAGVTGSGFIILAATLPVVGHMPVESVALVFGIDRFMSEARALTNLIGNTAATLVVARWENELDMDQLKSELG